LAGWGISRGGRKKKTIYPITYGFFLFLVVFLVVFLIVFLVVFFPAMGIRIQKEQMKSPSHI
jgi:uncharacterized membrane protein